MEKDTEQNITKIDSLEKRIDLPVPDPELIQLADQIVSEIEAGKQQLAMSINQIVKSTYWNIGRHIVEFEQHGNARAKYGSNLLSRLARILRAKVGRGYSHPNLNNMRKFYLMFPNFQMSEKCQTISDKLTWSGDNPPIGIVMGHYKDELMVEYATYGMDSNLFVSKYELFLPNKEELRRMVRAILK